MIYYHGSKNGHIKQLKPSISMHDKPYVYLTTNKMVATIYTVNAIERFFDTQNHEKPIQYHPWYSYGFNQEKLPRLEEYYQNAIEETYKGQSGYIYICKKPDILLNPTNIYCAYVTEENVEILDEIYIDDIYEALLRYESEGLLEIKKYEDNSSEFNLRIERMIMEDIETFNLRKNEIHHYGIFLRAKFPHLFDK